ncbi:hypothetical protein [Flavobacterium sp. LB1P71]|uniref:hypothetical protein n=1 Tax=Flavobacterium sp. LB1P71 TaxID=3401716 RepID=UPI003AABDDFB
MNFIQYLNENQQIKTLSVVSDPDNYDTSLESFIVSGINESFFVLALFLDNVKQSSVDFVNNPNIEQLSVINDTFTDLGTINFNAYFAPQTVVKISIKKEYITRSFQKPIVYPYKKPFFKDQNTPLDPFEIPVNPLIILGAVRVDYNTTTNKYTFLNDITNGKVNDGNLYYILTPRVNSTRHANIYLKVTSDFTGVPFNGPLKYVEVYVWFDCSTNEVYLSMMPTGTYTPIVLGTFGMEHTANGFKTVHLATGTVIEVSDIWL